MKLPIPKEEDGKRMTMMSGASIGRKGLLYERRETGSVGGRDDRGVRRRANMDFGSGDTQDFYVLSTDIPDDRDSLNWDPRLDSLDLPPAQSAVAKTHASASTSTPSPPSPPPSLPPPAFPRSKAESSSSESVDGSASPERLGSLWSHGAKDRESGEARKNSTLAVVEDGKEPNFTANESNPTVPAPAEPSKTSTLRLSDRTRSESEDDIEKMEEPEQEGTLIGHTTIYKTTATADNSPNSDKIDKNGNRSDSDQSEADNDCVVQCLYYTIQCCECVIS